MPENIQNIIKNILRDNIVHFYYYEAKLHGRKVRLNVAKDVELQPNGKPRTRHYLYSINDIKE